VYRTKIISDHLVFIKHFGILKGGETVFALSELGNASTNQRIGSSDEHPKVVIDVRDVEFADMTNSDSAFHMIMSKKLSVYIKSMPDIKICYLVNPENPTTDLILTRVDMARRFYGEQVYAAVAQSAKEAIEIWGLPHDIFAMVEDV